MKLKLQFLILIATMALIPSWSSASLIFDLATDWSDTQNPNGPWAYNEGNNTLPHVDRWLPSFLPGGQPAWATSASGFGHVPAWFKSTVSPPTGFDWEIGDVVAHSTDNARGESLGLTNVTWTSPTNGTINISGNAWLGVDRGRGNQWNLLLNGSIFTSGSISSGDPFNRSNPFDFSAGSGGASALQNLPVSSGDVIELQIIKTSGSGEFTGVNLAIEQFESPSSIPEPSSLILIVGGLLALRIIISSRQHGGSKAVTLSTT